MQSDAVYARSEAALKMGARLKDVYALAVAIEDAILVSPTSSQEDKADPEASTVRPGAK